MGDMQRKNRFVVVLGAIFILFMSVLVLACVMATTNKSSGVTRIDAAQLEKMR